MKLSILGIRGVPAKHGGFETFAEKLALYLVKRNWQVTVYCQEHGTGKVYDSNWQGIDLVHVPVILTGSAGSVLFDLKTALMAARSDSVILSLGYGTSIFAVVHRLRRRKILINMDGIEWRRKQWSLPLRAWLWANEIIGCKVGNHLIADHPEIKRHLCSRVNSSKITMIPYGAEDVTDADAGLLERLGIRPNEFALVVARPEKDNLILEIVSAFSLKTRKIKLVVLGNYSPNENPYHKRVLEVAADTVIFPGAIYEKPIVDALRYYCRFYVHGHKAGGTNPSLVEALGAGSPVLAHDNKYNRWVAGEGALYFSDVDTCASLITELEKDDRQIKEMRVSSKQRHQDRFTWDQVLHEYESLLMQWAR